jgi:moderate conductance mechanosensitive channel
MMQLIEPAPDLVVAGPDPAIQGRCAPDLQPLWELVHALRMLAFVLVAAAGLLWASGPGQAQMPGAPAADVAVEEPAVDPEALERIIQTLEDEPARQRLVEELRALRVAQEMAEEDTEARGLAGRVLQALSAQVDTLSRSLGEAAQGFVGLPAFAQRTVTQLADGPDRREFFSQVGAVLAAVLSGIIAYAVAVTILRRVRATLENRRPQPPLARLALLSLRLLLDLVAAGAFVFASMAVMSVIDPSRTTRILGLALINATALTLAIMAVSNFLLAPSAPNLRLLWLQDETAYYLHLWTRRLTVLGTYGLLLADAAWLVGAPTAAHETLVRLIGFLIGLMLTVLVLQSRREVARRLSRQVGEGRQRALLGNVLYRIADVWHVVAITVIIAVFVMWFVNPADGGRGVAMGIGFAVVILVVARLAEHVIDQVVARAFRVPPDVMARFPGLEQRANRYVSLIRWSLTIIIWGVALIAILAVWGIDSVGWITSGPGGEILASVISIAVVIAIAAVVWEFTSSWIARYLDSHDTNGESVARSARIRTLLPLLRNVFLVFLVGVVGLTVMAELGVNIAPLLAGAGIIGLAIGFGSQALVRDIITGLFILIEDTISVGEVVTVGEHTGVVEAMSIRAVRLRDLSGSVHTVPWGDVTSVVNLTKGFSYYTMDIGVAYREDVDKVIDAIRQVGADLQSDPQFGVNMLEPIDVLGLDSFRENAVVIKARLKTVPLKQWMTGREFNRRMKRRFDELGIEIPFPHRTIYFGEDKAGKAPPARVLVGETDNGKAAAPEKGALEGAAKGARQRRGKQEVG